MKKLFRSLTSLAVFVVSIISIGFSAENQIYMPSGGYYETVTPSETVLTVSSYTLTTESGIERGSIRYYQNTGSTNIMYFFVNTSSTTSCQKYLGPGDSLFLTWFHGTIYWLVQAGSAASTLSRTLLQTK